MRSAGKFVGSSAPSAPEPTNFSGCVEDDFGEEVHGWEHEEQRIESIEEASVSW